MTPDPTVETSEALVRALQNRFRGRMAGFIEGCGLSDKQERSMISTMKSLSYDAEADLIAMVHDLIRELSVA
jgi:hypothetical protein